MGIDAIGDEMGKRKRKKKISMSMMSHRRRAKRRERVWNSYYRRSFEWEVFGQIEGEMKRSALIWAVGLVIGPVSERYVDFEGVGRKASSPQL